MALFPLSLLCLSAFAAQNRTVELPTARVAAATAFAAAVPVPALPPAALLTAAPSLSLKTALPLPAAQASASQAMPAVPSALKDTPSLRSGASASLDAQAAFAPQASAAKTGEGASIALGPVFDGSMVSAASSAEPVRGSDGKPAPLAPGKRGTGGKTVVPASKPGLLLSLAALAAMPAMSLGTAIFMIWVTGFAGGALGLFNSFLLSGLIHELKKDGVSTKTFNALMWAVGLGGAAAGIISAQISPEAWNATMLSLFGLLYAQLMVIGGVKLVQRLRRPKKK